MSSSSQAPESWISAFCSLVGHEYFAEVSEDFIEDDFNLTGLQSQVLMYKEALEMILDVEPEDASDEDEEEEEDEDEDEDEDGMPDGSPAGRGYRRAGEAAAAAAERRHLRMASDLSMIESSAEMLYGLIHQRFITSRPGIQQMAEKFELGHFGHCPRVFCNGAKVLPVGCSDIPGQETVKLFCPACLDVYSPPNSRFQTVDGAFFGTTFGCLFFMTFPELNVGGIKAVNAVQDNSMASTSSPVSGTTTLTNNSNVNNGADKGRSSLSASLTSQQQIPPPPPLGGNAPPPTFIQPMTINGVAPSNLAPGLGQGNIYEPRIYGFRVSETAKTGPRMKWLRMRPNDVNGLDEGKIWADGQGATSSAAAGGDSEMIDEGAAVNAEVDDGEVEDADMDGGDGQVDGQTVEVVERKVKQDRRKGKRRNNTLVNGDGGGGATVTVGGG